MRLSNGRLSPGGIRSGKRSPGDIRLGAFAREDIRVGAFAGERSSGGHSPERNNLRRHLPGGIPFIWGHSVGPCSGIPGYLIYIYIAAGSI